MTIPSILTSAVLLLYVPQYSHVLLYDTWDKYIQIPSNYRIWICSSHSDTIRTFRPWIQRLEAFKDGIQGGWRGTLCLVKQLSPAINLPFGECSTTNWVIYWGWCTGDGLLYVYCIRVSSLPSIQTSKLQLTDCNDTSFLNRIHTHTIHADITTRLGHPRNLRSQEYEPSDVSISLRFWYVPMPPTLQSPSARSGNKYASLDRKCVSAPAESLGNKRRSALRCWFEEIMQYIWICTILYSNCKSDAWWRVP